MKWMHILICVLEDVILFYGHAYERARDSSFKEAQIRPREAAVCCLVLLVHTLCKPRLALSRPTCLIDLHLFAVFYFFISLRCVEQLWRPPAPFSEQLKARLCPDAVAAYSITFFPALINLPHQGEIISHHSGDQPEPAATSMCNDFCRAVIRVVGEIERLFFFLTSQNWLQAFATQKIANFSGKYCCEGKSHHSCPAALITWPNNVRRAGGLCCISKGRSPLTSQCATQNHKKKHNIQFRKKLGRSNGNIGKIMKTMTWLWISPSSLPPLKLCHKLLY